MTHHQQSKNASIKINQQETDEQKAQSLKNTIYEIAFVHLRENYTINPYPYYLFIILQNLSLMWYLINPKLNIYGDVALLSQLQSILKIINFHQFLVQDASFYQILVLGVFSYFIIQLILIVISCIGVVKQKQSQFFKYIRKIVNYQLIFTVKVLSGPILGLCVNMFYCQPNSYHVNQVCYEPVYFIFFILTIIIFLFTLTQILFFSMFYYIKNPLSMSVLGEKSRYYNISKVVFKLFFPFYFAYDSDGSLTLIFCIVATGLIGAYLVWHRFSSIHSYNQDNYYFEYTIQVALCWIALCNVLYTYVNQWKLVNELMSFIYTCVTAIIVGLLVVSIQKMIEGKFIKQCLQNKVKKTSMQKFIFNLIYIFLGKNDIESKLIFKVYSKEINSHLEKPIKIKKKQEKTQVEQIYAFLFELIQIYTKQNNSVILKTLKCYLLCLLGKKSYGIQQSLQLLEQKLGVSDQFMLYQFRKCQNLFDQQFTDKQSKQLAKFYRYYDELDRLQELVKACAINNKQYWEQLCQTDPSLAKLRNLATLYNLYQQKIALQYTRVTDLIPQAYFATTLYFMFLNHVGVNLKQTAKINQKLMSILQSKRRNTKLSQQNNIQDQNVSIISLNSIGNNLGVILNSNDQVKQLLGFQKNTMIGKNITKLMPKIYTELHNQFMLRFIRQQNSHLRPSKKQVTALNKQSFLVQVALSVKIMNSVDNVLIIVGFLKKITPEPKKGLLMYSANTGQVLGIDSNFAWLMNNKLSASQIVQQQIRLTALMPQINFQQLQKDQSCVTILQVGNTGDQFILTQKQVKVILKNSLIYQGKKICFLKIYETSLQKESKLSTNFEGISNPMNSPTRAIDYNAIKKNKNRKRQQQIYKMGSQHSIKIESIKQINNQQNDHRQFPQARKVQDYIRQKEGDRINTIIKLVSLLCIVGCSLLVIYIYVYHVIYLGKMKDMFQQFDVSLSVPSYQTQIAISIANVWDISTSKFITNPYVPKVPSISDSIRNLSKSYYFLTTALGKYQQNLQYNVQNSYNFTINSAKLGSITQTTLSMNGNNGLNNYIAASTYFLPTKNVKDNILLQQQALYINLNGIDIIPTISTNASALYYQFYVNYSSKQLSIILYLKIALLIISVFGILGLAPLGRMLNLINIEVVNLYNNIRLWDINQVLCKCYRFLQSRGEKSINKKKGDSLLKIFPNKTYIQIIQQQRQKQYLATLNSNKKQNKSKFSQKNKDSASFIQMSAQDGSNPLQTADEQKLLKGNERQQLVNVELIIQNKKMMIGLFISVIILAGIITCSYLILTSRQKDIKNNIDQLYNLGLIQKQINLLDYYAFLLVKNPSNNVVRNLIIRQINRFYDSSSISHKFIKDQNNILKTIYTVVQTLQQWLTVNPTNVTNNVLLANYTLIDTSLQKGYQDIQKLSQTQLYNKIDSITASCLTTQLIFDIIVILSIIGLVMIIRVTYLQPIQVQVKNSLNMLKIMPPWVIQRNPKSLMMMTS